MAEAAASKLGHERRGRYHCDVRCGMEAPQHRVAQGLRDRKARRNVFRKARRIARREWNVVPEAVGARQKANRSLGREMNSVRPGGFDTARDLTPVWHRKIQIRVSGKGNRRKAFWRQKFD